MYISEITKKKKKKLWDVKEVYVKVVQRVLIYKAPT